VTTSYPWLQHLHLWVHHHTHFGPGPALAAYIKSRRANLPVRETNDPNGVAGNPMCLPRFQQECEQALACFYGMYSVCSSNLGRKAWWHTDTTPACARTRTLSRITRGVIGRSQPIWGFQGQALGLGWVKMGQNHVLHLFGSPGCIQRA
jgi:hypothetical protein